MNNIKKDKMELVRWFWGQGCEVSLPPDEVWVPLTARILELLRRVGVETFNEQKIVLALQSFGLKGDLRPTSRQLAKRALVDQKTVVNVANALEKKGLLRITKGGAGRANRYDLDPLKGKLGQKAYESKLGTTDEKWDCSKPTEFAGQNGTTVERNGMYPWSTTLPTPVAPPVWLQFESLTSEGNNER
jgi:DNA-binding MarR family transcriptional regulator